MLNVLTALTALSLVDNWNQIQTYPEQQLRNGDRIIAAAVSDICHVLVRESHDDMAQHVLALTGH